MLGKKNGKLEVPYKSERIVIDANNLDLLVTMEKTRSVTRNQVSRIKKQLENGIHFEATIVVNKFDGKYRVIDGNHRRIAIVEWITEHKEKSIEIQLALYENLSLDQEKEVFRHWNSGRKQNTSDIIHLHSDELKIVKKLQSSGFPCRVAVYPINSKSSKGILFAHLLKAYFVASDRTNVFKPYGKTTMDFLDDLKNMNAAQATVELAEFIKFFEDVFGRLEYANTYQAPSLLNCIMTLYFDNEGTKEFSRKELIDVFKTRVHGSSLVLSIGKAAGVQGTATLYNAIRSELCKSKKCREKMVFRNTPGTN